MMSEGVQASRYDINELRKLNRREFLSSFPDDALMGWRYGRTEAGDLIEDEGFIEFSDQSILVFWTRDRSLGQVKALTSPEIVSSEA